MQITRQDPLTGRISNRELPVNQEQLDRWKDGELIQKVFPHLSADDREFIQTGIVEWPW